MTPTTPRDAALTYAANLGWRVLPTGPDKRPLLLHGVNDASSDLNVIDAWFARWPDANVAVATGAPGPQVLDVDHPELAPAAIADLHAAAEAITGRVDGTGRHLYFAAGADDRTRKWPWGELRGAGAYVVAPPSLHESGRLYAWEHEPTGALEPLPAVVLELVGEVDRQPFVRRLGVPHGERHGYLERYAEYLILHGYRDEQAIAVELEAEFGRACVPEPAPRADEFRLLARWVVGTDLMGRMRRRDAGVVRLTEVLAASQAFAVTWEGKKPVLPPDPAFDDPIEQCRWLTSVLRLDYEHRIVGGDWYGPPSGNGVVVLHRLGADDLRFDPASTVTDPRRLAAELAWQLLDTDDRPYPWTAPQAIGIARVVRLLTGGARQWSIKQEAMSVVLVLLEASEQVEGHPRGSGLERYECAVLLRPTEDAAGRPVKTRYLVDTDSGDIVVRVSDLTAAARRLMSTAPRGWLDGRMDALGWRRWTLQGHGFATGSERGPHARCDVYVGRLED